MVEKETVFICSSEDDLEDWLRSRKREGREICGSVFYHFDDICSGFGGRLGARFVTSNDNLSADNSVLTSAEISRESSPGVLVSRSRRKSLV